MTTAAGTGAEARVAAFPGHRHATPQEEHDWLSGGVAIEGAVETDAGLLVPDEGAAP